MKKKLLSILLTACMVLTLLPTAALAATGTGTYGAFTVTYDGTTPTYTSNTLTLGSGSYTISGTTTSDRISVASGAAANITLSNVNIDVSGTTSACAFDISGATVNLTLSGTNTLKSGSGAAGLRVPAGASLTITAASTGSLTATTLSAVSPNPGAGMGGNEREACGAITINGGTVTATGAGSNQGFAGAGIGGGGHSAGGLGGAGGTVTINGGIVTATGAENSAGIGGGGGAAAPTDGGGTGGTVTINGGTVIATGGGWRGAGIGGGGGRNSGSGATVIINGGSVKATGGGKGAAIGAGAGVGEAGDVAGTDNGTLKNGSGADVTLYTLTLPGINSTAVTALTTAPVLGYNYGTTDMKTDTDGKLYVYLPSGKTTAGITTADCIYSGDIASYAATLNAVGFTISGTVKAGITGAAVSGLTVNLFASSDTTFSTSVGSATTNGSGAYTIYAPNGSYVARVVGVAGSYAASVSSTITVSGGAVSGANITPSRAAYTGDAAPAPTLISKTDIQVVLSAVTVTGQTVEYGKNTSNATPTAWQDGTTFTDLAANTTYYFFARVKQAGAVEAGGVSSALTVTTKTAPATAPAAPTIGTETDKPTSNSITVSTAAGSEYYISTSATADWSGTPNGYFKATVSGTHKFDSLTPATQYYIHVRVAETENAMPSASAYVTQYTLPATPATSVVTVNYASETISFSNTYEVSTSTGFTTTIASGGTLTPGTTYYVRVKAASSAPVSEAVSFTIPARPATPTAVIAANITKTGTAITIANTVDGQEYQVNGTWYTPVSGKVAVSGLAAGTEYSILTRVKATENSFASLSSAALTVKTKTAPADAPAPPTVGTGTDKPTSNSITVSTTAGNEYYISTSATADWSGMPNGYFKATVSGPHKFNSLSPATQYYIHVRVAETDNAMPSASDYVAQYTLPATPAASVVTVNYASETISFVNTYEVSTSAGFTTTIASGGTLTPGTTYYVRVKSASGAPASEAVSFTIPARPAAPTVITADKTKNSITITPVGTQEYKIDSGAWQDSGSFKGLNSNTPYTVYTRVKATGTAFASLDYSMEVTTKSNGSVTAPTPDAITYDPNKKLANTTLPANWAWSDSETVPTVTNSGYGAVYTPTDTATVDYLEVAGYAVDGSGKVTITRTVPLTVNRATPTAADFTYTPPVSLGYNNTTKTAAVTAKGGILGMGTVTVKYYQGSTEIASPTNVGTYTVKIDLAQGNNYAAATAVTDSAWTFTIAKVAQAPLSITGKPASVTYGDTFTLSNSGGSGNGDVKWAVTPGGSATVNEDTGEVTIKGVGETTITATKAADGNYTDAVTDTYTFTPAKRLITVDAPSTTGGWTKTYDGKTDFDKSVVTVGSITNKVGADDVTVSVQSATYDTTTIGAGNKTLTITYAIDGTNSENYSAPDNTVISTASITAATQTITISNKTAVYTDKIIEIDAATVAGATGGTTPDGAITYTYYTKDTCTDADKTTVDKSGAEAVGSAPKNAGTYYVKATIAASGNYTSATSAAVTLTIYYPSSGEDKSSVPVIVDGKTVDMGTSEVKDGTTTVKVDQNKLTEQLEGAKDSVVIPITSKTDTASAQLVVQNVESMSERGVSLTIIAGDLSYSIPAGAIDTSAALKELGASDSSKVPFNIAISKLSNSSVTIQNGTLMVPPVEFTVTATYNGKSVTVEKFESYVQRVIEIPDGTDPKAITTAVVVEADGAQRHVPTEVYSENGKWYARINAMTNSTYALIQNSVSMTDTAGKWYDASVTEMASREIISGIGENMFAGERAITRAEFAAIIVRALGLPTNGNAAFTDVVSNAWYYGAVGTAFEYGIVGGKGDGIFDPSANITREEAMVMVARAAKLCGMDTTIASGATGLSCFEDASRISSWAHDSASFNVRSGLIKGSNGKIESSADITRAETATVVLRLLQKAGLVDIRAVV